MDSSHRFKKKPSQACTPENVGPASYKNLSKPWMLPQPGLGGSASFSSIQPRVLQDGRVESNHDVGQPRHHDHTLDTMEVGACLYRVLGCEVSNFVRNSRAIPSRNPDRCNFK